MAFKASVLASLLDLTSSRNKATRSFSFSSKSLAFGKRFKLISALEGLFIDALKSSSSIWRPAKVASNLLFSLSIERFNSSALVFNRVANFSKGAEFMMERKSSLRSLVEAVTRSVNLPWAIIVVWRNCLSSKPRIS